MSLEFCTNFWDIYEGINGEILRKKSGEVLNKFREGICEAILGIPGEIPGKIFEGTHEETLYGAISQ